jgi:hypothetical protein
MSMKDRPPVFFAAASKDAPRPPQDPRVPPAPPVVITNAAKKRPPRDVAKARREAIAKVANAVSEYMVTEEFDDLMYDNVTDVLNARGLTSDSESDEYGREEQVIIRGALRLVAELPGYD